MRPKIKLFSWILLLVVIIIIISVGFFYYFSPKIGIDPTSRLINAIISSAAFLLAFYAVYLAHLKGPDIDRIDREQLGFKLNDNLGDPEEIEHKYAITRSLSLQPFTLIFVNKGSRTGVIKKFEIIFTPSDDFNPFYAEFYFSFRDSDNSDIETPFIIKGGEVCLVKLYVSRITPLKFDSFEIEVPNSVKETDIITVITEVLKANKRKLGLFVDFLGSRRSLGKCSLQWVSTTREEEIILDVTGTYEQIIMWYNISLQKYDDLPPSVDELVIEVKEFIEKHLKKLKERLDAITVFPDELKRISPLFDKDRRPDVYPLVINWKNKLISDLESLNKELSSFDEKLGFYIKVSDDKIIKHSFLKDLEKQKDVLTKMIKGVQTDLYAALSQTLVLLHLR